MPRISSASPRVYTVFAFLFSVVVLFVAFMFVEPPPPERIRMAAGSPGGAYHVFAERYRDLLKSEKVTLEVVETAGSVENLQLLLRDDAPVDLALLQGGVPAEDPGGLAALAGVFLEPLWVFYRGTRTPTFLSDLRGSRLAIGSMGSGTRLLALSLLEANGVTEANTPFQAMTSQEAVQALREGTVDAAFFVANENAAVVRDLMAAPGVRLMNLSRAEAYGQRDHNMARVMLHAGAIDLARNIPNEDKELIAPTASVIAREDFHPALVSLLLQTLTKVHGRGGLFEAPGDYPAPEQTVIPEHDEAARFFRSGPPFLQRVLPFWIANLFDRMIVLVIPLLTLIIPLARVLPPVYRWRMRGKVNRIYAALARLEASFETGGIDGDLAVKELNRLEDKATDIQLPASFVAELYALRFYLDRVRSVIRNEDLSERPDVRPSAER